MQNGAEVKTSKDMILSWPSFWDVGNLIIGSGAVWVAWRSYKQSTKRGEPRLQMNFLKDGINKDEKWARAQIRIGNTHDVRLIFEGLEVKGLFAKARLQGPHNTSVEFDKFGGGVLIADKKKARKYVSYDMEVVEKEYTPFQFIVHSSCQNIYAKLRWADEKKPFVMRVPWSRTSLPF